MRRGDPPNAGRRGAGKRRRAAVGLEAGCRASAIKYGRSGRPDLGWPEASCPTGAAAVGASRVSDATALRARNLTPPVALAAGFDLAGPWIRSPTLDAVRTIDRAAHAVLAIDPARSAAARARGPAVASEDESNNEDRQDVPFHRNELSGDRLKPCKTLLHDPTPRRPATRRCAGDPACRTPNPSQNLSRTSCQHCRAPGTASQVPFGKRGDWGPAVPFGKRAKRAQTGAPPVRSGRRRPSAAIPVSGLWVGSPWV